MAGKFVCRVSDVPPNSLKECEVEGGIRLLIANAGGEFFGYQAMCPHQDVSLCEGLFDGETLTCHMHLWQWSIRTGEPIGLAEAPLERFALSVEADTINLAGQGSALDVGELFRGVAAGTLEKLAALARAETHAPGTLLYGPGDRAEDLFVLDSGRVEFSIGRDTRTAPGGFMLRKGEAFGWAAMLDGYTERIASARCIESSTVLRLNGKGVTGILEADPAGGFIVMKRLAGMIARYLAVSGTQ
ncbi:MAG: Rieske 2Fe-2S domain-containing protein [Alphaproteobacteria bacterium]|nr:Rieske 2Fe-2S domain-containing protein [Alphaproteobacteria bacterium]